MSQEIHIHIHTSEGTDKSEQIKVASPTTTKQKPTFKLPGENTRYNIGENKLDQQKNFLLNAKVVKVNKVGKKKEYVFEILSARPKTKEIRSL